MEDCLKTAVVTTREYIGAVMPIDDLKASKGEFKTPEDFYTFWRRYSFKIGRVVQQQQGSSAATKTAPR